MFDIVTIGSATQDIFIESDQGKILSIKAVDELESYLAFDYGAKVEVDQTDSDIGGGAINSGVNFSNLGFKTAAIVKLGDDLNAKAILQRMKEKNVSDSLILKTDKFNSGFSVILTSFEGDRTVLAHRGANSHLQLDEIPWDIIKQSKWVYIAPLSGNSNNVLDKFAQFAEENGVSMAFNPGSTQIKSGIERLRKVISTAEVLVMNRSEASKITEIPEESEVKSKINFLDESICKMLCELKSFKPKVVAITDGKCGVYAYDGKTFYFAPSFPAKVVSTLGAGDAFASTFVASLQKYNWDIEKALIMASINASAVVQSFGAQSGLKNFDEIEELYRQNQSYNIQKK